MDIVPFRLDVPQSAIADLHDRLDRTRWPDRETVGDWSQGAPLEAVQGLCNYWRYDYDWRRCEAMLNGLGQFKTKIDGLDIHFLHIRSPEPDAMPLLLTHGWPGSVIEFVEVASPLSNPAAHGADPQSAFHLVVPSLPGYGFSDRPTNSGWTVERIAAAWVVLMERLGYHRYVAQGGDWGSLVTTAMAHSAPPGLAAIHLNMVVAPPSPEDAPFTDQEATFLADVGRMRQDGVGYSTQQSTRPQTLGYGLTDSPAGQAAWIYEKYAAWSDCDGVPEKALSRDAMLDNIMLYWLTASATSSARLYWESYVPFNAYPTTLPFACSIFPGEIARPSRRWVERKYPNLIYFGAPSKGGHFAAFEQPAIFADELRRAFASVRNV